MLCQSWLNGFLRQRFKNYQIFSSYLLDVGSNTYEEREKFMLWWVCGCRSSWDSGTDNALTSSGMLCRVSSFTFDICRKMLFSDAISKEAFIRTCSPRSEFAVTLVTSCPEDACIDLIAISILGATMLSIAVHIAFCILSSTVPRMLLIYLSILSLKHLSKNFKFTILLLFAVFLLEVPTVKSRSLVPSLTTMFSFFFVSSVANKHILIEVI